MTDNNGNGNNNYSYTATYRIAHGETVEGTNHARRTTTIHDLAIQAVDDHYALKAALYQGRELTQEFPPAPSGRTRVELTTLVHEANGNSRTLRLPEEKMFVGTGMRTLEPVTSEPREPEHYKLARIAEATPAIARDEQLLSGENRILAIQV